MHVPSYITNMLRQKKRYNRANQVPFLSQEVKGKVMVGSRLKKRFIQ